jgi:hypothetical protein
VANDKALVRLTDYCRCMRGMESDWDNFQPDGPERLHVTDVEHILTRLSQARKVEEAARRVSDLLTAHGASIVPHLMDTDDNPGQELRNALDEVEKADAGV